MNGDDSERGGVMGTPLGAQIVATRPDGSTMDVTEAVQGLYDIVIQSLDWGSGFISEEEALPVARLAEFCGFVGADEPRRYLRDLHFEEGRKQAWVRHGGSANYDQIQAEANAYADEKMGAK